MDWRRWVRRPRILGLVILVVVVVAGSTLVAVALGSGRNHAPAAASAGDPSPPATATVTPPPRPLASPTPVRFAGILDGVPMTDADWQVRKDLLPVAVMFDNSPDAYPQTGLDRADVVYEAFVEGGITRFMGVYWSQEADYLEPVRSARTPFLVWASELDALYAHAGEAVTDNEANAAGQIFEWDIKDLTAFGGEATSAYFRDFDRYAPHNLVTSTIALREAALRLSYHGPAQFQRWLFKADGEATATAPRAEGIEINFQGSRIPWQLVQWRWDSQSRTYARFQHGGPHVDGKTGKQLQFKNVVVMTVGSEVVDDGGHVLLDQNGSGSATVFMDGRRIDGTWRKKDRRGRTQFYDSAGQEIAFDRGPIFIEVTGFESTVTVAASASELPKIPEYAPPPPVPPGPDDSEPTPAAAPSPSPLPSRSPSPAASRSPSPAASGTPRPTGSASASPTSSPSGTATAPATQTPPGTTTATASPPATNSPPASATATPH